jgi:DNA ligase (NAD+)
MDMILNRDEAIKIINDNIKWLNDRTAEYDAGVPTVSDVEWDRVYFALVKLENEWEYYNPESPTQKIQYAVVNELQKKIHNHPMLSLDKTKDWNTFAQYFDYHSVVGMLKLDGLTCTLHYQNGNLIGAETRGNGQEGEDILHNALVVKNIPNRIDYQEELVIDGEIICTIQDFEPFKNDYANPRNFAAGSIRLLDSNECAKRNLKFYAWNLVKGGYNLHAENLNLLSLLGFTVVPWTAGLDWDARDYLEQVAREDGLPIDGLVGRFNDILYGESLGATSHHSRAAYAFKFADETAAARLTGIEWTMGRTGVLTPVAVFTPIELEGTTVERANLHNISVMKELLYGPGWEGQEVQVFKANMIIPQIQSAEADDERTKMYFTIPTTCPICGQPTEQITEIDSTVLMCSNPACEGKLINRLDHFCGKKGLDIKGLSKATLEKLIEWKWVSDYIDIFELDWAKPLWVKKPGFGEKSVSKLLTSIDAGRFCELHQFISALGIPLIGQTAAKELANYFKTWEAFIEAIENNNFKFYDLPGFGIEMHYSLKNFDYKEAKYIYYNYLYIKEIKEQTSNDILKNKIFCITGTVHKWANRDEVKAFIESFGGKVTSSVSKNTDYLLNNDINSTTSKNKTAKSLGIPIITEDDLLSLLEN